MGAIAVGVSWKCRLCRGEVLYVIERNGGTRTTRFDLAAIAFCTCHSQLGRRRERQPAPIPVPIMDDILIDGGRTNQKAGNHGKVLVRIARGSNARRSPHASRHRRRSHRDCRCCHTGRNKCGLHDIPAVRRRCGPNLRLDNSIPHRRRYRPAKVQERVVGWQWWFPVRLHVLIAIPMVGPRLSTFPAY